MSSLTKICCRPASDEFIVLFLRMNEIKKDELNLRPSYKSTLKITNHRISSMLLDHFKDFKDSSLDLSDFFDVNIVSAVAKRRKNEFTLRKCVFSTERKVKL